MDVYYAYNYAAAGWMILQSIPLLSSPTMMVTMLSPEVRESTPLEVYFSRSLGFAVITIGLLTVLLTGSIPLKTSFADPSSSLEDPTAPYALPALIITATYHATVSFYCYTMWNETGNFGFGIATIMGTILAASGVWCVLFATSDGRISRKTGADKRTSGFPFKNVEADKRKAGKKGL
ncbi:hypothetical protein AOL_s00007g221 [Orbilia oligospora ATCC 24927]|uniref:Uncharacterized protein n=1 Tax=Arthrobotrys oligospora (strain ATCC 24927 / CBS 115.81 / DSM 1491) TaxID=756982 RepID=G1X1R2_ARTOA|nr:hypothetical protein AOL_s00007g221 [Orbilia oligospora ATCC 24927]EGX52885.1 hypothetical protein AOL_s00007g221 [Orbilia oligospora ATCC 24927]